MSAIPGIIGGRISQLIILLMIVFFVFYCMRRIAKLTKLPKFREIAALKAIPEVVGRAAETNRPIHYSPGSHSAVGGAGGTLGPYAIQIIASFSILSHVAKYAARMKAPLIVTMTFPEALPIVMDVVQNAYKEEGQLDTYDPDTVRFISEVTESYTIGTMGLIAREKISANILIGAFHSGSVLNILEAGAAAGAMTIGGTARQDALPFFALFSDYLLMGEENFAAGAMLSGDARQIGSIQGQDWSRFLFLAIIIAGFILYNLGFSIVLDFLAL